MSKTRETAAVIAGLSGTLLKDDPVLESLSRDIAYLSTIGDQALHGKRPELKHLKALIADAMKKRPSLDTSSA